MPTLDIDMFNETPKVGDKIQVTGKIKSINEDSGKVEASYDDVKIINDNSKKKKSNNNNYSQDNMPMEMNPNTQTLDQALGNAFPNTQ